MRGASAAVTWAAPALGVIIATPGRLAGVSGKEPEKEPLTSYAVPSLAALAAEACLMGYIKVTSKKRRSLKKTISELRCHRG